MAAALAAVAGLTLAACGQEPAGSPSATAPPATSATADSPTTTASPEAPEPDRQGLERRLARLEADAGARVGLHLVDTGSGVELSYRAGERFAHASTFKVLAAGAVLADLGRSGLSRRVRVDAQDLVPYSPVTETHVGDALSVREVVEAAVSLSDNTAANLLLDLLGGPAGLAAAIEEDTGDDVTQVVRREPDLNTAVPGDDRDTTTPAALVSSVAQYVVGDVLPAADRRLLEGAMRRSSTGADLVRAAVPDDWVVGDKSGTGGYGTRNDVAVLRPPGGSPIVLAVLTTHDRADAQPDAQPDDRLVAAATEIVLEVLLERPLDGYGPP